MPQNCEKLIMNFMGGFSGILSDNCTKIQELLQINRNGSCADCGMSLTIDTAWAVLSYGIFVCDDCKLVHIQQENHCKAPDQANTAEDSVTGILPTSYCQHWEEKDLEQMKLNGNEKVNQKLLSNVPPWQYRPMANDGIKHKEYWIKYKYGKGVGASEEIPKTANKSFIGIQFSRPMPKGVSLPCCAVLQNEKLYLTSDIKNEEIRIENIETVLLNSKRIGKDNGVQLTYRTTDGSGHQSGVTYTYLQHENMETVLDWINLVLYTKFNLLEEKYPSYSKEDVAKMLNCVIIKESYLSAGQNLIYVSLSEARIACFRHHLDEQPLFHLPVSKSLKLTGAQYLEALANFFEVDVSKIHGYDDWNISLDHALKLDKLAYLADELTQPVNSMKLLPPKKLSVDLARSERSASPEEKVGSPEEKVKVNNSSIVTKIQEEIVTAVNEKTEEKTAKNYECYPPIGPMGEMGKVARGELPPEAIKPPPPKVDPSRAQLFGMTNAMSPGVSTPPLGHPTLTMPNMPSISMTQQQPSMSSSTDCYPPISGPVRDISDVFHSLPRMPQDDIYPVIDEFKPMSNSFRMQDRRARMPMPFDSDFRRVPGNNGIQSPTDLQALQHLSLTRSASWNPSVQGRGIEWQVKQAVDPYLSQAIPKALPYRLGHSPTGQEHVIMENLQQQWQSAERKLLTLIHNAYVPASNMAAAGLDANSLDHAQTCISELFDLLWKKRYDLALSFLRGFREVFSRSSIGEIRNQFIGVGELDTMKQIFLEQGREKFSRSGARNSILWKHQNELENSWNSTPLMARELSADFSPWGLSDVTATGPSKVWGSTTLSSGPPSNTDPWNNVSTAPLTHLAANGNRPFNRAPSRPVSLTRSSFSETSPTEGSFDSKASSNSGSPGVVTPPTSLDPSCMPSPALTGIETTLKNLFLNSSSSGSTLWN